MRTLAHNPFLRIAHKSLACFLALCIVNMPVWALNVNDATVSAGGANLNQVGNTASVGLTTNRAVLDWTQMSATNAETLNFTGAGGFAVLNRVAAGVNFDGTLNGAGGHVFVISPNGVIIGPNASITASAFTASGLDITNGNFMSGIYQFQPFAGGVVGDVTNHATIDGVTDQVNLLGKTVMNDGTISLPAGGVVVMTAGDRVYLGEPGGDVLVEVSGIEDGMVTNNGTINAPGGTIVMAAGDIYSTTLGMKVFDGAGKITQNGTLNADADTYDGGTIQMLAGEEVSLTANSITTVNAIPDGLGTVRPDGGDIIIESTETVNIDPDAFLSAKGNGWYDADGNFRFDFGVDTSFSGSIRIAGKYLNLPSPKDYVNPAEFLNHFDLVGYEGGQIQSGVFTVGNNEGDMIVAQGAMPLDPAANTVYEEWIEDISHAGVHIDTLSAGNITIADLNLGDSSDLGLIGGAGNISFRTQFNTGGIAMTDLTDIIGTLDGGDIFMVAGSGGISVGRIGIINEDKTGDPGQIILATVNGGDISTGGMRVESGNHEIISISSAGDITINGGILVATNEVPDALDKTATADICIDAGDDITINGPIEADTHGKVEMTATIHIDAGLDPDSNDEGEAQAGMINIDLAGGQIVAVAEESGPAPGDAKDLYSEATIQIHTSAEGDDAINIINGAKRAVQVRAKVQGKSPLGDTLPAEDPTDYADDEIGLDGGILKTQIVKINIQSAVDYDSAEYENCDGCVKPPFLPPQPEFFLVKNDSATVDWRAGYTIEGTPFDAADLDVLLNDNGKDDLNNDIPLYDAMIVIDSLTTEKGGTLEWVEYHYTDGDGIEHAYDGFIYTPPSYDVDFEWDGTSDYATFTDSFEYRGQKGDDISLNIATVTITVQNAVPTLAGDSDTIHMNTSADFDLSALVTDIDGTPGELTGINTGTYGDLSYNIVEGLIPVTNGDIATDSGLIPDTLTISGDTIIYAPLDGYVSPNGEATTFGYTVTDDNISGAVFELPESENLSVTVTNDLPTGVVTLDNAAMNANGQTLNVASGDFSDTNSDDIEIVSINPATDDYNKTFGGTLDYNGSKDPYVSGDTYNYTADAALPGYVGEDDFVAQLSDGQKTYYTDGHSEDVYGSGTIDLTIVNELPTGAIVLDDAPMNANGETLGVVSGSFTDADGDAVVIGDIAAATDDYNKTFGGTLTYDGDAEGTYNYTADAALPGYVGEDDFVAQLSDGQKNYVFKQVDGIWVVDTENTTDVYGSGTIDLTIVNELPTGAIVLEDAPMNADGETLGVVSGSFTDADGDAVVIGDIAAATDDDNKTFGGTMTYDGDAEGTYNYTADAALPGYVGEDDFVAQLSDGQKNYVFKEVDGVWVVDTENTTDVYGSGTIDLTVVNELPTGAIVLEDAPMNASGETLSVVSGAFTDDDGDDFVINDITKATDDDNMSFGGTLNYNGDNTPYNNDVDGTYDYTADAALPGYVGEDDFDVELWDGQIDYTFIEVDGIWIVDTATNVYGSGTIDLEVTNELPEGNAWFGQVHMDSQDVGPQDLEVDFGEGVNVSADTYTGSVIGSDNYGGTLVYDGDTWTYSTDPTLPGYVGDDNDDYGQGGYVADDLFSVNLSSDLGQQYDYWFEDGQAPEGYEFYAPSEIYRKAVSAQGTVSVDITNALPTIDGTVTIEHMDENIENQVFATDHLDGNPINELDALSISDISNPGFGDLTLIDNGDGTYSYTYDPAEGFVGNDSFKITVYDGQRDYVFVDGEIQSNSLVPVEGTVNMKITNIIPSAAGDLGEVTPGDSTPQSDVTSPVLVTDPLDAPQQDILDNLSIVKGIYTLPSGSTLEFTGSEWIYTPASGAPEQETFTINVWDGQYDYTNVEVRKPVYGEGTVQVSYTSTPPSIPAAPLPLLEIPQLKGCPAVMEAAATELAVNSDELQLLIANSMATNPNLQPCDACENLLQASAALKGINEESLAAMNTIFNTLAPIDAPFDQTVVASIQTAFANFREKDTQLAAMTDEEYQEYQQYAMADEVIEAFVSYVAVLDNDLKLPVGDAMTLVMDKYFGSIETSDNPNLGAYIIEQIQASQSVGEPIVASAD